MDASKWPILLPSDLKFIFQQNLCHLDWEDSQFVEVKNGTFPAKLLTFFRPSNPKKPLGLTAAKERPCVTLCKIGSYLHPPGHCSHPSSSGVEGQGWHLEPSAPVTWLWFGGTVLQNSGNSTSHKTSVIWDVPVPKNTGSMPTQMPTYAYVGWKRCPCGSFPGLGAYLDASAGFLVRWSSNYVANDFQFAYATLPKKSAKYQVNSHSTAS